MGTLTSKSLRYLDLHHSLFEKKENEVELIYSCSSVAHSCPTLCDPKNCSTPGLPVLHHLLELAQTHVHCMGDAIQPSHLCHPLLLPPSIFPRVRVFSNESVLRIRWPMYWSFDFSISPSNEYSGLISFRMDWVGSPCNPRDSQESSLTPHFKSINSLKLCCCCC